MSNQKFPRQRLPHVNTLSKALPLTEEGSAVLEKIEAASSIRGISEVILQGYVPAESNQYTDMLFLTLKHIEELQFPFMPAVSQLTVSIVASKGNKSKIQSTLLFKVGDQMWYCNTNASANTFNKPQDKKMTWEQAKEEIEGGVTDSLKIYSKYVRSAAWVAKAIQATAKTTKTTQIQTADSAVGLYEDQIVFENGEDSLPSFKHIEMTFQAVPKIDDMAFAMRNSVSVLSKVVDFVNAHDDVSLTKVIEVRTVRRSNSQGHTYSLTAVITNILVGTRRLTITAYLRDGEVVFYGKTGRTKIMEGDKPFFGNSIGKLVALFTSIGVNATNLLESSDSEDSETDIDGTDSEEVSDSQQAIPEIPVEEQSGEVDLSV